MCQESCDHWEHPPVNTRVPLRGKHCISVNHVILNLTKSSVRQSPCQRMENERSFINAIYSRLLRNARIAGAAHEYSNRSCALGPYRQGQEEVCDPLWRPKGCASHELEASVLPAPSQVTHVLAASARAPGSPRRSFLQLVGGSHPQAAGRSAWTTSLAEESGATGVGLESQL